MEGIFSEVVEEILLHEEVEMFYVWLRVAVGQISYLTNICWSFDVGCHIEPLKHHAFWGDRSHEKK